jgi:hypothetical protein
MALPRRGAQPPPEDDEVVEGEAEEAQPAATEFVPEASAKPKSNVYTVLLILSFVAFFGGCWLSGREAWEHYDAQFFVFTKHPGKTQSVESAPAPTTTEAPPATPPGDGKMK